MLTNNQVAELLEKSAQYIENLVSSQVAQAQEVRTKEASTLAQRLAEVTGEAIDDSTISKIASVAPEVTDILNRFTGSPEYVDSMGGPESDSTVKIAGSVSSADQRFISWCNS